MKHMTALQLHHIALCEEHGDLIVFADSFSCINPILESFFRFNWPMECDMAMDNDLVMRTVDMTFRSLTRIQKDLNEATLPGLIEQLVGQFKQAMLFVTFFLVKLLQRSLLLQALDKENQSENSDSENSANEIYKKVSTAEADVALALKIFKRVCKEFPILRSPNSGYWAPLPHFMFDRDYSALFVDYHYVRRYYLVLQLFIDCRLDVDATDSDGNTLLHVVAGSSRREPDDRLVKMLLDNGAHSHCRNKNGKTPLDVAKKKTEKCTEVIELLEEHMKILNLKCIAAKKVKDYKLLDQNCELPACLVKFVSIH